MAFGSRVNFHIDCRACALSLGNCVFYANRAAGHDLGPQSGSMGQSSQDAGGVGPSRVSAGFAEPRSAQADGPGSGTPGPRDDSAPRLAAT